MISFSRSERARARERAKSEGATVSRWVGRQAYLPTMGIGGGAPWIDMRGLSEYTSSTEWNDTPGST